MFEMSEQNIKKKDTQKVKKTTKNVDIVISNDEKKSIQMKRMIELTTI